MEYKNYSISSGKGKLYLKEKQPTPGYEEVLYGVDGKSKTYHQYVQSIKGIPTYFDTKEIQHDGRTLKFLELTLMDGDVSNKVSVSLKNKNGYSDETKLMISSLLNLEMGQEVTLSTAKSKFTTKAGVEKEQLNIYVNYVNKLNDAGKGLSTGFIAFNDIPKPTSKIVAGETSWDWTPQTEFYYEKLNEILVKFANKSETPTKPQPTTKTAEQAFEPATNLKEDKPDDLPFA